MSTNKYFEQFSQCFFMVVIFLICMKETICRPMHVLSDKNKLRSFSRYTLEKKSKTGDIE